MSEKPPGWRGGVCGVGDGRGTLSWVGLTAGEWRCCVCVLGGAFSFTQVAWIHPGGGWPGSIRWGGGLDPSACFDIRVEWHCGGAPGVLRGGGGIHCAPPPMHTSVVPHCTRAHTSTPIGRTDTCVTLAPCPLPPSSRYLDTVAVSLCLLKALGLEAVQPAATPDEGGKSKKIASGGKGKGEVAMPAKPPPDMWTGHQAGVCLTVAVMVWCSGLDRCGVPERKRAVKVMVDSATTCPHHPLPRPAPHHPLPRPAPHRPLQGPATSVIAAGFSARHACLHP